MKPCFSPQNPPLRLQLSPSRSLYVLCVCARVCFISSARRSTCESLFTAESPRRSSSARAFGTPSALRDSRESRSTATAISAVAAWHASASARPAPMNGAGVPVTPGAGGTRRGAPLRLRSLGPEAAFSSSEQAQLPVGSRTPSRTLSRNTSYDNLLRSPLVGQGVGGPAASSPMPRGFPGQGSGAAAADAAVKPKVWRWGQDGDEFLKTPKAAGGGGGGRAAWGEDDIVKSEGRGIASSAGNSAKGGIRRDRERDMDVPPPPLTGGRGRRAAVPSNLPSARGSGGGGFQRADSSSSSISFNSGDGADDAVDDAVALAEAATKLPPSTPRASAAGDAGGARPKTPSLRRWDSDKIDKIDKISPPGTTEVTRKARKLAMMAEAAAETGVSTPGGAGSQPDTQDLLKLANAKAAGEKPPARAPRRGKLMRLLSQDGGSSDSRASGGAGGSGPTPTRRRLMRMTSLQDDAAGQGHSGGIVRTSRKRMAFRRANSLSAAEHKRREEETALNAAAASAASAAATAAAGAEEGPRNVGVSPPGTGVTEPTASQDVTTTAAGTADTTGATTNLPTTLPAASISRRSAASPTMASSPRARASQMGEIFNASGYAEGGSGNSSSRGNVIALGNGGVASRGKTRADGGGGHRRSGSSGGGSSGSAVSRGPAPTPPPMPTTIVLPSADVSLGLPHSNISPLLRANQGDFPFVGGGAGAGAGMTAEEEAAAGAEAVVRDCLYNSHGMVALDGYLWKPGSIRLVRRWMMLVDNTLYYFVKPG